VSPRAEKIVNYVSQACDAQPERINIFNHGASGEMFVLEWAVPTLCYRVDMRFAADLLVLLLTCTIKTQNHWHFYLAIE
jgi:hypothetical protein